MKTVMISSSVFSPEQIAVIVVLTILAAGLIAANVLFYFLSRQGGERKLYDANMQKKREELLARLTEMRAGRYVIPDEGDGGADEDPIEDMEVLADEGDAIEEEISDKGEVLRLNRSFTARLTQAHVDLKGRYSELKNYVLSYGGVKERMSWTKETFSLGRRGILHFMIRGKTLCLSLALDPKAFDGTKYKVDDMSARKNNKFPCMYKLTSDRKTDYAKVLIDLACEEAGAVKREGYRASDYTLPYKSTEVLIKNRLVKVVGNAERDFEAEDAAARKKGITYNRSFEAKIIQSNDALKASYNEIKRTLTAYEGVTARYSWKREAFCIGRNCFATLSVRGKTLVLALAADPAKFVGTKYKVVDRSAKKNNKQPTEYKFKDGRKLTYAKELVALVATDLGLAAAAPQAENFVEKYVSTPNLIRRGLIRVSVSSQFDFKKPDAEK